MVLNNKRNNILLCLVVIIANCKISVETTQDCLSVGKDIFIRLLNELRSQIMAAQDITDLKSLWNKPQLTPEDKATLQNCIDTSTLETPTQPPTSAQPSEFVCPAQEHSLCASWTKDLCEVKKELKTRCPYLCGICKASDKPSCADDPNCHISPIGCRYQGIRPSRDECTTFGRSPGLDYSFCKTSGCNSCHHLHKYAKRLCPISCGICPHPCPHVGECQNGGKLNIDECKCDCPFPYMGGTCLQRNCTGVTDEPICGRWEQSFCLSETYKAIVLPRCPIMCGVCL